MNRQEFEEQGEVRWEEFDDLLSKLSSNKKRTGVPEAEKSRLPGLFRQLCSDFSLAQHRMYGLRLCDRLNDLVIRGYNAVYRDRLPGWKRVLRFVVHGFPSALRAEWRLFWLCSLFFWGPAFAVGFSVIFDPKWVQAALGPMMMDRLEDMYGGGDQLEYLRGEYGANFAMFAFYIANNITIDFRIFAGGILAGVGSLLIILFNGVYFGAAAGYIHYACVPEQFWSFVSGHSSWELLGFVIVGVAGMRLGLAFLRPGQLSRRDAMAAAGKRAVPILYGGVLMTFIAAIIEGFWSAQPVASEVKYTVGIAFWVLLAVYFFFSGRRFGHEH